MNDGEWDKWRAQWTMASGPLPDVRATARRHALRHQVGTWTLIGLYAFGVAGNVWAVLADRGDPVVAAFLCTWAVVVGAALLWVQRRSKVRLTDGPREALAFFEQRVGVERTAAQIFRWAHVVSIVFISVYYRDLFGNDPQVKLVARLIMGLVLGTMLALSFLAPRWAARRAERQRRDVELWRRWIEEQQL